jgi:tRNA (guanine37-N1)-methyltransferase
MRIRDEDRYRDRPPGHVPAGSLRVDHRPAIESGALEVAVHDLRSWTDDKHRTTDDSPFGGGPGMVMKPDPVFRAVAAIGSRSQTPPRVVIMTPQGRLLDQSLVAELATHAGLLLVCGRYEGFDERIRALADYEVSIGDYILTGGELPALVLCDAVARLQPGVLGAEESAQTESFADGLLEYPQYTRPASFRGMVAPDVLLSGNHARIAAWRRREAIRRTAERRPDLIERAELSDEERAFASRVMEGLE